MLMINKLKSFENLSEAEKSVAEKILELQDCIEDVFIRELAQKSFTSTSAITRLCHKLGFNGYHDFKIKYIKEIKYLNEDFDYLTVTKLLQKVLIYMFYV